MARARGTAPPPQYITSDLDLGAQPLGGSGQDAEEPDSESPCSPNLAAQPHEGSGQDAEELDEVSPRAPKVEAECSEDVPAGFFGDLFGEDEPMGAGEWECQHENMFDEPDEDSPDEATDVGTARAFW